MTSPAEYSLAKAYFSEQIGRSLATLEKIVGRPRPVALGRVIPEADDLAFHEGRRIDATVMFLDICKFSQRPAESQEEQHLLMQILALFFTEMIKIIEDHGGVVEKNTGDGLMAYFTNDPSLGITVQHRALTAALTMFAAADHILNPLLLRSNVQTIDFRICMDHGPITIAKIGAAKRFGGIVAVGNAANVASKMLGAAGANVLLLGGRFVAGIPPDWFIAWAELETLDTGWHYTATGQPYPFWRYNGRWVIPQ